MKQELNKTTDSLTLVSHHLCPYVQRAAISLIEKGTPFERRYVDLGNKPDWFRAISPLGKVPLLKVGDAVIFESAVILEYLEDTQPTPLHPQTPMDRARHRAWIEFGSSILNDIAGFYNAPDETALIANADILSAKFGQVETELDTEPYFAGKTFRLVDAVYGPIFRYFDTFDRIADFGILGNKPKIALWRTVLSERPSVQGAVTPDYPARLEAFLKRRNGYLSGLMKQAA